MRTRGHTYPLQLGVERVRGLQEAPLLVLVPILDLQKFSLQLPLKQTSPECSDRSETVLQSQQPTWCTIRDWTCLFRTCIRAVVTTERTSGTTISLRMSLMSRWFLWKRAAAVCFTEKPSS